MLPSLPRILLVEDDPNDAHLALAVFKSIKVDDQVCVVSDGMDALDFLYFRGTFRNRPPGLPALVLLDLKLPRLNGFEVLSQVRNEQLLQLLPIVIFSSSREDRDIQRAYELGANAYVVKNIDFGVYSSSLKAIAQFWNITNQPPAGCLNPPGVKSHADTAAAAAPQLS